MNLKQVRKNRTHQEILRSAVRIIRRRGVAAAGVADVMKSAGLTVGGFYGHFDTKEAMVTEAFQMAMREMSAVLFSDTEDLDPNQRMETVLKRYLSRTHRDHPEQGCPLPAVASEIANDQGFHRQVFAAEFASYAEALAGRSPSSDESAVLRRALGTFALMFGGLTLARALRGTSLSDEMLEASRDFGHAAHRGFDQVPAPTNAKER